MARAGVNGRSQIWSPATRRSSGAVLVLHGRRRHRRSTLSKGDDRGRASASRRPSRWCGRRLPAATCAASRPRQRASAWISRAGSRGAWYVGVQVGDAPRRASPTGAPACASARRRWPTTARSRSRAACPCRARQRAVRGRRDPAGHERARIAASPAVRIRDGDLLPRVAIRGTTVVYRLRDGAGGRWEAIRATDLAAGTTRTIARLGRRAARMSDPAVDATRIVWSQTDFRRRQVRPLAHPEGARLAVGSRA